MLDENIVVELARRAVVSSTFRRLPPEKKERIYRKAVELFGEYGYDGLPVDRLCREAGISKGSFFQYFLSKTHLLEFAVVMFDDYLSGWAAELRARETSVLARDRLLYLHQSLVVNARLRPAEQKFYLFVTQALDHAGVVLKGIDLERHVRDYVREIIEHGEKTGEIRGDFDVDLTVCLVSTVIEALLRRQFSGRRTALDGAAEYLISFLFDGIKA